MAKKPLYRVPQNERHEGWPVLNTDDEVVATCATRTLAREKARELIAAKEEEKK